MNSSDVTASSLDSTGVEATIRKLFDDWSVSYEEMCQSLVRTFAPECVWENPGFPATVGAEAAIELCMDGPRRDWGLDTIRVTVHNLTYQDGMVWTERTDDLLRADGSLVFSCLVAGIMELDDGGRVAAWREYSKRVT